MAEETPLEEYTKEELIEKITNILENDYYYCPFCYDTFIELSALKKHMSLKHNIKHPISHIEILAAQGYEEKEETKTVKFKMNIKSLGVL